MTHGFALTVGADACVRTAPPPVDRPPLVTSAATPNQHLVLYGTLFYRREREAALGVAPGAPDAAFALAAYLRDGAQGLERLEGDFAVAVWDRAAGELTAVRDPLGGYPLYWAQVGGRLTLATALGPVRAALPSSELDPEFVAEYLIAPGSVNELPVPRTAYRGADRLLPGHTLRFRPGDDRPRVTAHRDWAERVRRPAGSTLEEVAAEYREAVRAAVRERAALRPVVHLSGGMDSTLVAVLARDGRPGRPLTTVSLSYDRLPELARERPYLDAARALPGMSGDLVAADDLLDFDAFADAPPHDEPYMGLWRLALDRALVRAAADRGAGIMLTGIGADELLDVFPFHLTEHLCRWRFRAAWREACRWAAGWNCSPWQVLVPFGLAPRWPGAFGSGVTVPEWVRPEFARRYALAERARAAARAVYTAAPTAAQSFMISAVRGRAGDVTRWSLAAPLGMAVGHPFLDTRVLALGLGLPPALAADPGRLKPVLAEAARGLLPEAIRTRPRKGHFNEVYYGGLARNRARLEALIQRTADPVGLFDKPRLLRALAGAALGGTGVRNLHQLNAALALIRWWHVPHDAVDRVATAQPA